MFCSCLTDKSLIIFPFLMGAQLFGLLSHFSKPFATYTGHGGENYHHSKFDLNPQHWVIIVYFWVACLNPLDNSVEYLVLFCLDFFFLNSRKPHLSKSVLCEPRWASKIMVIPDFYKRCTSWLELETCCVDLKLFTITLRPLGTFLDW